MHNRPLRPPTETGFTLTMGDVIGWVIFLTVWEVVKLALWAGYHWLKSS